MDTVPSAPFHLTGVHVTTTAVPTASELSSQPAWHMTPYHPHTYVVAKPPGPVKRATQIVATCRSARTPGADARSRQEN